MVISVINLKGGVGKTTLCLAIGEWLALSDEPLGPRSVVFIDLDPQCNLSSALLPFGEKTQNQLRQSGQSVFHMFLDAMTGQQWDIERNLVPYCDPSGKELLGVRILPCLPDLGTLDERILEMAEERKQPPCDLRLLVTAQLARLRQKFDYILIDCPPSLSVFTSGAMIASDYFVVPAVPEFLSMQGLDLLHERVAALKRRYPDRVRIEFLGTIFNRVDLRRRDAAERMRQVLFEGEMAERFMPFLKWMGDWKPLYLVSNYFHRDTEKWSDVHSKYGGSYRVQAGLEPLFGGNESKNVADVVFDLAKEFHQRCQNGASWARERATILAKLLEEYQVAGG